ncbi:MAG: hypothetical protein JW837_13780 [Sedimentisphaerales bacterium]|nr:hypothetical protein [Sedimentisphaerales bacterium]
MKKIKFIKICVLMTTVLAISSVANADLWETFVIRNSNVGNIAPTITDDVSGGKLFAITLAGQKAGWGTNLMNGMKVGDILSVSITRDSSVSGWGPYMNIWITDGNGGYAVIANEPSHTGEWTPGTAYDTTWDVLKNATVWVYENNASGFILPNGVTSYAGNPVPAGTVDPHFTFEDFADYVIVTPPTYWGGSGAPDDLLAGSYTAYGFNWIFGDTQSNYLGGYLVSDPTLVPVPVPAAVILGLIGMTVAGIKLRKYA